MVEMVDISEAEERQVLDVRVDRIGFDKGGSSWEALANMWDVAPLFVKSELWKSRLDRGVRSRCRRFTVLRSNLLRLLHCQTRLIYFEVITELWGLLEQGTCDDWEDTRLL